MKKIKFALLLVILLLSSYSHPTMYDPLLLVPLSVELIVEIEPPLPILTYGDFIDSIGYRESRNNYSIVNTLGFMGRFQFGTAALKHLKYTGTKSEFLDNPEIQDEYMLKLLQHNKMRLQYYIDEYSGTEYNGQIITESGILAAAHLKGVTGVKRFFNSNNDSSDAYGTYLSEYLLEFSGFDLNLN